MDRRIAIIIAVERYQDPRIQRVTYAEEDAKGISHALVANDYEESDIVLPMSSNATRTTIESRIRQSLGGVRSNDSILVSHAGHGFSEKNLNYITCYDTQLGDLANTSIAP